MKHRCCIVAGIALLACSQNLFAWKDADYGKYDYESFERLPAANERIDQRRIDYPLLNAAIFYETNRQRHLYGENAFQHSSVLERAAAGHSMDMVRYHFFSHESPVKGKEDLRDRVTKEGLIMRNATIGENIDDIFGIEYQSGRRVYRPDDKGAYFSYAPHGEPIQSHTYVGLAKAAVTGWMNSPQHRKNILNRCYQYLGIGSAHYRDASFFDIDRFKLTQDFFGKSGPSPQ
jgi:uncharacterized protein YkwD